MEMLSSFGGEKHKFYLVVVKLKHVRSCPVFDITYTCKHEGYHRYDLD